MISPLLTRPQGCQGCQKIWKTKLKTTLVSWSAKIQPKLNEIGKTFRKQGFFDNFCSILTVFHSFFNFGWILALQLTRVDFSLVVLIFWHTWHPASIVEWNKVCSFWSLWPWLSYEWIWINNCRDFLNKPSLYSIHKHPWWTFTLQFTYLVNSTACQLSNMEKLRRKTNALSFYRSQTVLCRSKFFESAQKFDCN